MKWRDRLAKAIASHPKGKPLTETGGEIPDPVPMDPPIGYRAQPSMFEVIRKMIKDEKLKQALEEEGLETPEDADDFDVGDDPPDPSSPYEHNFDPPADPRMRVEMERRVGDVRTSSADPKPSPSDPGAPAGGPASPSGPGKPGGPAGTQVRQ